METFANVWDALAGTAEESANLTLRSEVMSKLEDVVASWEVTQKEAARRLAITQPRLNDLLKGKIDKFSLDALIALAGRAGLKVRLDLSLAA